MLCRIQVNQASELKQEEAPKTLPEAMEKMAEKMGKQQVEAAEEVRLPTLTLSQHTELSSLRRGCVCLLGCS